MSRGPTAQQKHAMKGENRLPTSWYAGAYLRAHLIAARVNPGHSAWCIVDGHAWSPYAPIYPVFSGAFEPPTAELQPIRAFRSCVRCGKKQDYDGKDIE